MTIDFLHLYCKCPHCTTMFRASVSDIDASEGWVKCGHCRKVFDCRENEIKPADFVSVDKDDENDSIEQTAEPASASQAEDLAADELVPQISLFEESDQLKKSADTSVTESTLEKSVDHHFSVSDENKSVNADKSSEDKLPSVEQKMTDNRPGDGEQAAVLAPDSGTTRMPAPHASTVVAKKHQSQVLGKIQGNGHPRSTLKTRLNFAKPQAPVFSAILLAKVQSWKKRRSRFKKTKTFPYVLIAVALFAVLIWQIAIVNYTKLSQYRFLSVPLIAVCSIVTCNHAIAPTTSGFEILHASVRRHTSIPNVMSVSAKLINFSDENKIMPTLRLDLTNDNNAIIASRTIELPENPQFVDTALTELAPGQDVQLLFNINNPDSDAHGFQLSLVSHRE